MEGLLWCFVLFLPLASLSLELPHDIRENLRDFNFPDSNYTIRYLSQAGNDTEICLQPPPGQNSSCRTIRYGLTGESDGARFPDIHNVVLLVSPGEYSFKRGLRIFDSSNIIIAKNNQIDDSGEIVFMCESFGRYLNNFFLLNVEKFAVIGITFTHCGPIIPALSTNASTGVIKMCKFRDNINSGAYFWNSDIHIMDSLFENNSASSSYNISSNLQFVANFYTYRRAGGLSILYDVKSKLNYTILIRNCTFQDNLASVHRLNHGDIDKRPSLYIPQGHGGALLISIEGAVNHQVDIEACTFIGNSAQLSGGAISVLFFGGNSDITSSSSNNSVRINGSIFKDNVCTGGVGGAVSVNTFEAANYNKLAINSCTFQNNSAELEGGAFCFIIEDNVVEEGATSLSNTLTIKSSNFTENYSPNGGSAISLVSNARVDQATSSADIANCTFIGNQNGVRSALQSLRYPIILRGSNVFKENTQGAITLLQTRLDAFNFTKFEGNMAEFGGAIYMLDQSTLHINDGVEMVFSGNHANRFGGVIRAISTPLFGDVREYYAIQGACFIQYSSSNVSVRFVNNTAGLDGAAIYASEIFVCSDSTNAHPFITSTSLLSSKSIFHFSNNRVTNNVVHRASESIAAEPSNFIIRPKNVTGAPGQRIHFEIGAEDQSLNQQEASWSTNFSNGTIFTVNAGIRPYNLTVERIDAENATEICRQPFQEEGKALKVLEVRYLAFYLISTTTGEMLSESVVKLSVTCCHPGYKMKNGLCEHEAITRIQSRADDDNKYIYIERNIYAQARNASIVWATLNPIYGSCNLTSCLFKYDAPEEQCHNGKTGFLCGDCPNGTNLELTRNFCIEYEYWQSIIIAIIVLTFAIVCALVMVFNISVPSELRGFLFYLQVVGFQYANNNTWHYYLSSIFGFSLYIPYLSPYPGFDALHASAFGFILPLIAIITIVIYILSARFIKYLSNKTSFDGIWFLTFIIYKFTADTCFILLRCQKVFGGQDKSEYVFYFNGSIRCFSGEDKAHLTFSILALLLSVIIILFPVFILLISFRRFKFTVNITDVLNKDVKISCRWWASFDLFRRLLYFSVVLIFNYFAPVYRQLGLLYIGLFIFLVFAYTQPYTSKKANVSETLILLDMVLINALFLNANTSVRKKIEPFALILLLLPFIATSIYFVWKFFLRVWNKFFPMSFKERCIHVLHKLIKKLGINVQLFIELEPEHEIHHPLKSTLTSIPSFEEDHLGSFNNEYKEYREELLEDS